MYYYKDGSKQAETTCPLSSLIAAKGDATIFVETGTNSGAGVQNALDAGFDKIISIETIESLHRGSQERFKGNDKVTLLHGCSRDLLLPAIKDIQGKMLFWLDGHEYHDIPLIEELSQIKSLSRNDHTILIDDVRMFKSEDWNGFELEPVLNAIMLINTCYNISYFDSTNAVNDILMASTNSLK